jgi:hypothetical protein
MSPASPERSAALRLAIECFLQERLDAKLKPLPPDDPRVAQVPRPCRPGGSEMTVNSSCSASSVIAAQAPRKTPKRPRSPHFRAATNVRNNCRFTSSIPIPCDRATVRMAFASSPSSARAICSAGAYGPLRLTAAA